MKQFQSTWKSQEQECAHFLSTISSDSSDSCQTLTGCHVTFAPLRRSRRDIPIHLDYREQDSSDKESSDDEMEVEPEVIEIDDKEHSPPAQKRDSVSA